jgi:hypothetical protein
VVGTCSATASRHRSCPEVIRSRGRRSRPPPPSLSVAARPEAAEPAISRLSAPAAMCPIDFFPNSHEIGCGSAARSFGPSMSPKLAVWAEIGALSRDSGRCCHRADRFAA